MNWQVKMLTMEGSLIVQSLESTLEVPKCFPLTSTRDMHSYRHTLINKSKFKNFYDVPFYKEKGLFYTPFPESLRNGL